MATPPPDLVAPPWLEFIRRHIWVIAFVFGAVTLTLLRPALRRVPEPPPVMFTLPSDWTLVDQRGEPFSLETMRGKVWVASFVFTSCPSTCPAVTRAMADLRDRFERNDIDVELVSISVDPERDTPEVLAGYATNVDADPDKWRFVTGDPAVVRELVVDGFKLGMGERETTADDANLYDIAHSTKLALVDAEGNIRGYYGIEPDEGLDEVFHRADHVWRILQVAE